MGLDVEAAGMLPLGMGIQASGGKGPEPWYRGAEWREKRRELNEARKAAEEAGNITAGVLGGGGGDGPENQTVPLEEVDDEVDDAALLDDADEADEELEAPEAEAEAEADEEVGEFEGDEDDEGVYAEAEAEAMEVDGRGGLGQEHYGHGEARLSGALGTDGMAV